MQYIRIKLTQGDISSSQIMTETEFAKWAEIHLTTKEMWSKCRDGISVTISKVKRSALLINKPS